MALCHVSGSQAEFPILEFDNDDRICRKWAGGETGIRGGL